MQRLNVWIGSVAMWGLLGCGDQPLSPRGRAVGTPGSGSSEALSACVRDGRSPAEIWSVGNGHGEVQAMAVAPDDAVALAGTDGSIKIWNLVSQSAEQLGDDPPAGVDSGLYGTEFGAGAQRNIVALAFDAEGMLLAGDSDGTVTRRGRDGELDLAAPFSPTLETSASPTTALSGSHDGRRVVFANQNYKGDLAVWDLHHEAVTLLPETNLWSVSSAAFTNDDARLVVAGEWYGVPSIEVWDIADLEVPLAWWRSPIESNALRIEALAISPDDTKLVVGATSRPAEGGGFVAVLDLQAMLTDFVDDEVVVASYAMPGAGVTNLSLASSGDMFTAAAEDGTLRFFDVVSLEELVVAPQSAGFVKLTPEGTRLITSGDDGMLRLWSCE